MPVEMVGLYYHVCEPQRPERAEDHDNPLTIMCQDPTMQQLVQADVLMSDMKYALIAAIAIYGCIVLQTGSIFVGEKQSHLLSVVVATSASISPLNGRLPHLISNQARLASYTSCSRFRLRTQFSVLCLGSSGLRS